MSFKRSFIPIIKGYISSIKISHKRLHSDSLRQTVSAIKSKVTSSQKIIGLSSVASLCTGIGVYAACKFHFDGSHDVSPAGLPFQLDPLPTREDLLPDYSVDGKSPAQKKYDELLSTAIYKSKACLLENGRVWGAPGISVCVSVKGAILWNEGIGFADLEQEVLCNSNTVMRIASISKPITMAAVAKLIDEGKLDIEEPVQTYVPNYPKALYKGKEVIMKVKHLLNHTSGIRHYDISHEKEKKTSRKIPEMAKINKKLSEVEKAKLKREHIQSYLCKLHAENEKETPKKDQFNLQEFYIKENFSSVEEILPLFQDDELHFEPGSGFNYSTHGWTLVSAVIEGASGKKFETVMKKVLNEIGLKYTYFEKNNDIIFHRARQYRRGKNGNVENAPYVNNSCKYAGGGFLSTVGDLVKFGNTMLYCYQNATLVTSITNGYIQKTTMEKMWELSSDAKTNIPISKHGLGWFVEMGVPIVGMSAKKPVTIYHRGHALGGSSILMIKPGMSGEVEGESTPPPEGVVVAILANLEGIQLLETARSISDNFAKLSVYNLQDNLSE